MNRNTPLSEMTNNPTKGAARARPRARLRDTVAAMSMIFAASAQAATIGPIGMCSVAALQPFAPKNTTLLSAQVVAPGPYSFPPFPPDTGSGVVFGTGVVPISFPGPTSVPQYCVVEGNIKTPLNDEGIGFKVGMPTEWNEKYIYASYGGYAGSYDAFDLVSITKGYATATGDTGHKGGSSAFAPGQPGKLIDYAYRGNYLSSVAAKSLITGYYQKPPTRSIAEGCSGGGRATLAFAQRFPKLFDGYIVNAPAMDWSDLFLSNWVVAKTMYDKPSNWIPPAKYKVLREAVLAACDSLDGLKDGVLQDPRACHFDPSVLRCKAGDAPDCFTQDQLNSLKPILQPTRNSDGRVIARGWPLTGEEPSWFFSGPGTPPALDANGKPIVPQFGAIQFAVTLPRDFIFTEFPDRSYDWRSFDPDYDLGRLTEDEGLLSTIDTDLAPMARRGSKMLFIGPWADQALPPQNWIDYVDAVRERLGKKVADNALRLFMVPGMTHCGGGSVGTDRFDALGTVEKWLDTGRAPDVIVANHVEGGQVTRTRPVCAYPNVAEFKYGERGVEVGFDPNDPNNWQCVPLKD